jgi:hypothetical protein
MSHPTLFRLGVGEIPISTLKRMLLEYFRTPIPLGGGKQGKKGLLEPFRGSQKKN